MSGKANFLMFNEFSRRVVTRVFSRVYRLENELNICHCNFCIDRLIAVLKVKTL